MTGNLRYSVLFFLFILLQPVYAQKISVQYKVTEGHEVQALLKGQSVYSDSLSAIVAINKTVLSLHAQAYILASLDSISIYDHTFIAWITPGDKFRWARLKQGNVEDLIVDRVGYREKFFRDKPFHYKECQKLEKEIVKYAENDGYPFAQVRLDSLKIEDNSIEATLRLDKGPFIVFDSLVILGTTKLKNKFMLRYLRLEKGQPYSQEKMEAVTGLLSQLSYVKLSSPPSVEIRSGKAVLFLMLADRKTNQADGIIGFLPNSANNGKILVTGEVNLSLKNLFNSGKQLDLEWKRFNQQSQTLNFAYNHPRLFGSPLDLGFKFSLVKQDTSFLNVDRLLELGFHATKNSILTFTARYKTSSQLGITYNADTTRLLNADYNQQLYGVQWRIFKLDDVLMPMRGWQIYLIASAGEKKIIEKGNIPPEVYNGVGLRSVQYTAEVVLEGYSKLGKKSVLYSKLRGAHIFNEPQNLFLNDMYRLGGLKTFRGFNEWYFYASSLVTATAEYRFYTEPGSYFLLFADFGYLQNVLLTTGKDDFPIGLGGGVCMTTKAGIFSFIYALGKSNDQLFSFNQSKIHFGLISRF